MSLSGSRVIESVRRRQLFLERNEASTAPAREFDTASSSGETTEPQPLNLCWDRIVPAQRWKLWALAISSLLALSGLLQTWTVRLLGESAADELLAGVLERVLIGGGSAAWWLTAQLCLLAWWIRSHSRIDYSGRFHAWGWAAGSFLLASMLSFTELHRMIAHWVTWSATSSDSPTTAFTAAWLLPCAAGGLALWATLGSELRDCVASRLLHCLAGICGVTLIGLELWSSRLPNGWNPTVLSLAVLGLLQWANLWTVVIHVHRLVHVTPDPPAQASAWTVVREQSLDRGWIWLTSRMRRRPNNSIQEFDYADASAKSAVDQSESATASQSNNGRRRVESADGESHEIRVDQPESTAKGISRRARKRVKR